MLCEFMTQAGLYIHIPFCRSRCSYCDFATGLYQAETAERYVRALVAEISASPTAGARVDTIYFGGGTPSALAPEQIAHILAAARENLSIRDDAWIFFEANPEVLKRFADTRKSAAK